MKLLKTIVCFWLLINFNMVAVADKEDHGTSSQIKSRATTSQNNVEDAKLASAMKNLEAWMEKLEKRLPDEIDKAKEKLLASLEKSADLSTKLFDVLAQSEQQFEPDEKTVFGAELAKFSLEEKRKLVIAWTTKLQDLLRKRVVKIAEKLAESENPKAKELSEALRKLNQAHFQAYEEFKKEIKTSQDPKLFCFACDGHVGEFNYHDDMERQIKEAMSAWISSAGSSAKSGSKVEEGQSKKLAEKEQNSEITPPGQGSFEKYKTTLSNGRPNPNMYPKPENMAPVLGLTSPEGFSYMKWKGRGQHFVKGPQGNEYGVEVDWSLLKKQSVPEQKRVLGIFEQVLKAGVSPFKVIRPNNDGYCLWCNLGNFGPSKSELKALRERVN